MPTSFCLSYGEAMKNYLTLADRLVARVAPDMKDYRAVKTEELGCKGCAFFKMNVQCSAIPCQRSTARPYPVQYVKKEARP